MVPSDRVRVENDAPWRPERAYVLYWMTANRRLQWNYALDRALEVARELRRPLLVFEPLRIDHRWASLRFHTFVVQGMRDNAATAAASGVSYFPWVEPEIGASRGLLASLAADAAAVVTDTWPSLFHPRMLRAAAERLDVRLEAVDSVGVVPLAQPGRDFTAAQHFRRHLHKTAAHLLAEHPVPEPLAGYDLGRAELPAGIASRWPASDVDALLAGGLSDLALDPLAPTALTGGPVAGENLARGFLTSRLSRYHTDRNDPDGDGASGLSPWLHFGHVSAHRLLAEVVAQEAWTPDRVDRSKVAAREGFWGMGPAAEAFVDECVVWRELGHQWCYLHPDAHEDMDALPDWALATLRAHTADRRPVVYDRAQLAAARTHDPLWNAAQRQLVHEGRIQNYLRMLWGKKVLEWSATPREAWDTLFELNNRYALDGRDPNSVSGISWTFGRFDRPWGPERPIFGTIRYMSSDNTAKKLSLRAYLQRWGRPL